MNRFYQTADFACLGERPEDSFRSVFQVDRDRILYTSAFRRLQGKTQVFVSGEYDFYRTRLTHSLEVAQIGRSICGYLLQSSPLLTADFHVDPDLVEGICLAHDLGHPPFGHAGERALHEIMLPYGGFEGNAQTLRLITETIYSGSGADRRGMNPSRAFLDGLLKYKRLFRDRQGGKNHYLYDAQEKYLEFTVKDGFSGTGATGADANRSLECQIMDWADDTAYSLNDVIDGVEAGFINSQTLERWGGGVDACHADALEEVIGILREGKLKSRFGRRIGDFIRACSLEKVDGALSNRYAFRLVIDETARRKVECYKLLARDLLFRSSVLQQYEFKGRQVLKRLFEAFAENYLTGAGGGLNLLPLNTERRVLAAEGENAKARWLCDFIAGMTDAHALRVYRRLFDPSYGSITDLG